MYYDFAQLVNNSNTIISQNSQIISQNNQLIACLLVTFAVIVCSLVLNLFRSVKK